jgi:hypothetical protein
MLRRQSLPSTRKKPMSNATTWWGGPPIATQPLLQTNLHWTLLTAIAAFVVIARPSHLSNEPSLAPFAVLSTSQSSQNSVAGVAITSQVYLGFKCHLGRGGCFVSRWRETERCFSPTIVPILLSQSWNPKIGFGFLDVHLFNLSGWARLAPSSFRFQLPA